MAEASEVMSAADSRGVGEGVQASNAEHSPCAAPKLWRQGLLRLQGSHCCHQKRGQVFRAHCTLCGRRVSSFCPVQPPHCCQLMPSQSADGGAAISGMMYTCGERLRALCPIQVPQGHCQDAHLEVLLGPCGHCARGVYNTCYEHECVLSLTLHNITAYV